MTADDDPEVAAVRRRHDNIPQQALPIAGLPPAMPKAAASTRRPTVRVYDYRSCPRCANDKVAIVAGDGSTQVYRRHTRTYPVSGRRETCPASGTPA